MVASQADSVKITARLFDSLGPGRFSDTPAEGDTLYVYIPYIGSIPAVTT